MTLDCKDLTALGRQKYSHLHSNEMQINTLIPSTSPQDCAERGDKGKHRAEPLNCVIWESTGQILWEGKK